jgi:hypothetical protein
VQICVNESSFINRLPNVSRYVVLFLGVLVKLRKATISLVMYVCLSERNNSSPTGRVLMKFNIWAVFRKCVEKIQVSLKSDKNNRYFT